MNITKFEEKLRTSIAAVQALGYRITPSICLEGKYCCPLVACWLVDNPAGADVEDIIEIAAQYGVTDNKAWSFIYGFDNSFTKAKANHDLGKGNFSLSYYRLGQQLRSDLNYQHKESNDDPSNRQPHLPRGPLARAPHPPRRHTARHPPREGPH